MIKKKEVTNDEKLELYIKEKNFCFSIVIGFTSFLMLIFIIIALLFLNKQLVTYFSIFLGILGTFLIGISTIHSSYSIIELTKTKWGFNLEKANNLLYSKLFTGIGTCLLLSSLIM